MGSNLKIWIAPVSLVEITLYYKQGAFGGFFNGYKVYYSTNNCSSWTLWSLASNCPNSETCTAANKINLAQNTTVNVYVVECDSEGGSSGTGIYFNASDNTSTCPSNTDAYGDDGTCQGQQFQFNTGTSNKNVAITVYATKIGYAIFA